MATEEDKAAARALLEALRELNKKIDDLSYLGIEVSFTTVDVIGRRNSTFLCGGMTRTSVERILP